MILRAFFATLSILFAGTDLAAAARKRVGLDFDVMLDAIAAVESGNNPLAIGRLGERGRCQIRAATWDEVTSRPFLAWAPVDCAETREVERMVLARMCAQLLRQGHQLEPALVAAAWRYGAGIAPRMIRGDSSQRTANLYFDRIKREAAR